MVMSSLSVEEERILEQLESELADIPSELKDPPARVWDSRFEWLNKIPSSVLWVMLSVGVLLVLSVAWWGVPTSVVGFCLLTFSTVHLAKTRFGALLTDRDTL